MNDQKKAEKQITDALSDLRRQAAEAAGFEKDRSSTPEDALNPMTFYMNVLENIEEGIMVTDKDDRIVYVNNPMSVIAGIPKEQISGVAILKDFSEDTLKYFRHHYLKAKEALRTDSFDSIEVVTPAGRMTHQSGTLVPMVRDGRFDGMICTIQDTTERKKAEDALRASEEKFSRIFRMSPDIMTISRLSDGIYIDVNDQYTRQTGYTRKEAIGKSAFDLGTWADPKDRDRMVEILRAKGEIQGEEYRFRSKDGTIKTGQLSARIIRMNGDLCLLAMIRDITEKIEMQMAQQESEGKYRLLAEQSLMGMHIIQEGVVKYANQATCNITGYSREELTGWGPNGYAVLLHPDERAFVMEQVRKKQRGESDIVVRYEWRILTKSGAVRWVESFSKTILFEGRPADFVMMIDVTERRETKEKQIALEERLNRAEKMEALGILAGGVAHDLNNLLGVVIGYTELLMKSLTEENPVKNTLARVLTGGQSAAAIVQDLLTLARRGVSSRGVLNLNAIVESCRRSAEYENLLSLNPSVHVHTDLEPDLLNISGSQIHLEKTLYNLAANAAESMHSGGTLTIRTTNQYLDKPVQGYDELREGDYVVLSVSDTGEGIPAGDLRRIFEPFYTKKVMGRSGTGLGLAVVWGTMKDHDGYINVVSEEGKGSTFTLYFPVTRENPSAETAAVSVSEYTGNGESVLVVDDVKEQREMACLMLERLNYAAASVSNGQDAVDYLKNHKTDLVILDMIMEPGMDGLDTYKKILEICPKQKTIIVSGFSESDRVRAAQALGAGAYLKKPYVIEKLGIAVKKELERK